MQVERGSPIRLLRPCKISFRNPFANSSLGKYNSFSGSVLVFGLVPLKPCTHAPRVKCIVVTGEVTKLGQSECEIEVRENWGIRVVVNDVDGKEKVVWGQELKRCSSNKLSRDDPYEASSYHKVNRSLLKGVKVGSVVEYPVGQEYIGAKVKRIVRAGNWQRVLYSVPLSRCLHERSVRCTKKMIERARRDNRLWGSGLRPPSARLQERHVISAETFEHLQKWIFSTDLLEPLKASEQSTQRGHCFAVKEAASTTFPRYVITLYP